VAKLEAGRAPVVRRVPMWVGAVLGQRAPQVSRTAGDEVRDR